MGRNSFMGRKYYSEFEIRNSILDSQFSMGFVHGLGPPLRQAQDGASTQAKGIGRSTGWDRPFDSVQNLRCANFELRSGNEVLRSK